MVRNFIKEKLVNYNEHILPVFSRSKISRNTNKKFSLFGGKSRKSFKLNTVYLDDFLRNYYPSIKTALNHCLSATAAELTLQETEKK